jgi:hypothetical protein
MSDSNLLSTRLLRWGVGLGLLASVVHLTWEATHGGVRVHHLLASGDMPSFSNWWGLLVLPLLGGIAVASVQGRLQSNRATLAMSSIALIGSALVGLILSALFAAGYEEIVPWVFLGVLVTGGLLPIYRPEYLFGFVLGLMLVFGPVIPLAGGLFAAGVSFAAHALIGLIRLAWSSVRGRTGT